MAAEEERDWQELFALRERVLPELEKARQAKRIGKSLEAKVTLHGRPEQMAKAMQHSDTFRELLNVSQFEWSASAADLRIDVDKADGTKCERCWHWETDVGRDAGHPTICARCVEAVKQCITPA